MDATARIHRGTGRRGRGVSHQMIGRLCEHPIPISEHPSKGRTVDRELSLQA